MTIAAKINRIMCKIIIQCILFSAFNSLATAQDTIKLSESAYRLKSANYGFKRWKLRDNRDTIYCYMEIALPDTLVGTGKNNYKTEIIDCKESFERHKKDSISKIFDQAQGHYVKFYYDNGQIKEEGKWFYEYWEGMYKRYYPNSVLAERGVFLSSEERHKIFSQLSEKEKKKWSGSGWGMKTGKWEYFSKEERLVKVEIYDSQGKLIKQ